MRLGILFWAITILVCCLAQAESIDDLNKSYALEYAKYQSLISTKDTINPAAYLRAQAGVTQSFEDLLNRTINLNIGQHDKTLTALEARLWFALGNLWYQKKTSPNITIEKSRHQDIVNAFEQSMQLAKLTGQTKLERQASENRDAVILASKQSSSQSNQITDAFQSLDKSKIDDFIDTKTINEASAPDAHKVAHLENLHQETSANRSDEYANERVEKLLAALKQRTEETSKESKEIEKQQKALKKKAEEQEKLDTEKFFQQLAQKGIDSVTEKDNTTLPFLKDEHQTTMSSGKHEPVSKFYITPPGIYQYLDTQAFNIHDGHRWKTSKEVLTEIKRDHQKLGDTLLHVATVRIATARTMDLTLPAIVGSVPDLKSLHFLGNTPSISRLSQSSEGNHILHLEFADTNPPQDTQFSYTLRQDLEPHPPGKHDLSDMGAISPEILKDLDGSINAAKNDLEKSEIIKKYLNDHGFYSTSKEHSEFINASGTNKLAQLQRVLLQQGPEHLKPLGMDCDAWAELGVALMRHYKVPSRLVLGFYDSSSTGKLTSEDGHGWTRVYDGSRWQNQDMTASRLTPEESKRQSVRSMHAINASSNRNIQSDGKSLNIKVEDHNEQKEYQRLTELFYQDLKNKTGESYANLKKAESMVEGFKMRENIILNALKEQQKIHELSADGTQSAAINAIQKKQASRIDSILDQIDRLSPDSYYRTALLDALHTQIQVYLENNHAQPAKSKIWIERAQRLMSEQRNRGLLNLYASQESEFNPEDSLYALGPFLLKNGPNTSVPKVAWATPLPSLSAISPMPQNSNTTIRVDAVDFDNHSHQPLILSSKHVLDGGGIYQQQQKIAASSGLEKDFSKSFYDSEFVPLKESGFAHFGTQYGDGTSNKVDVEFLDSKMSVDPSKTLHCQTSYGSNAANILTRKPLRFYCIKITPNNEHVMEFYEDQKLMKSYSIDDFEMVRLGGEQNILTLHERVKKQTFMMTSRGLVLAPHKISNVVKTFDGTLIFFSDSKDVCLLKNEATEMSVVGKQEPILLSTISSPETRQFLKIILPNGEPYKLTFQGREYRLLIPGDIYHVTTSATLKDGDVMLDSFAGPNQSLQSNEGKRVYLDDGKLLPFTEHNEIDLSKAMRFGEFNDTESGLKGGSLYVSKTNRSKPYQMWAEQKGRLTDISFARFPMDQEDTQTLDPSKTKSYSFLQPANDPTYGNIHVNWGGFLDGYPFQVNSTFADVVEIGIADISKQLKNYARSAALVIAPDAESFELELAPNASYIKQIPDPSLRMLYLSRNYFNFAKYLEKPDNPWMYRAEQMMQSEMQQLTRDANWHQAFPNDDLVDIAQKAYESELFSNTAPAIAKALRERGLSEAFLERLDEKRKSLGPKATISEDAYTKALGSKFAPPEAKSKSGIEQQRFLNNLRDNKN